MCYEFAHACEGPLIDELNVTIGAEMYFMVCIRRKNYIHVVDNDSLDRIQGMSLMNGLVLHIIPEAELMNILNFPLTKEFQAFHGSKVLFNGFIKRHGRLKR